MRIASQVFVIGLFLFTATAQPLMDGQYGCLYFGRAFGI
jgi:hypothetical protein